MRDLQADIANDYFKNIDKDGFRKPEKKRKFKKVMKKTLPKKEESK